MKKIYHIVKKSYNKITDVSLKKYLGKDTMRTIEPRQLPCR